MNVCKVDIVTLNEYIDGTLSPLEKMVMEEHLKFCPQCRRELNQLKLLDWEMKNIYKEDVTVPSELALCRESVLQACFDSEAEGKDFTLTDLVNLQVSNFSNAVKFLGFLPGLKKGEQVSVPATPKKKSVLRRIAGF